MGEIPEWLRPYCKQDAYIPTKEDIESLEPQSRDEMLLKYLIDSIASDLSNYYTKSEVDNLIDTIPKFDIKVVQTLPSSNISPTTVYLVPSNSESSDIYKEYIYVNNNWELLGIQKSDLSNYYNKTEINNLLSAKVNSSDLSTVATSGSYNDLSNKPTIPTTALYTGTLLSSGWTSSAPYTQTLSIQGILATDVPVVDVVLSSTTSTAISQTEAWSCVSKIETAADSITATCLEEKPTINIPIQLKVVR